MMRGGRGNRDMRRMLDRAGVDMSEIPNVQEVTIKTDKKEIIIKKPAVTEMKTKGNTVFSVEGDDYEEVELEVQIFSDEDIQLIRQQTGSDEERARQALEEADGDIARAIMLLSTE